jgi:TPR repeat protein
MSKKLFDAFPDWCYEVAKTGRCEFKDVEKHCRQMIKETDELDTVKLFLVWALRTYTDMKEQEVAKIIDEMAFQERGDTTGVYDDYIDNTPPTKAQITACNKRAKKTLEIMDNMTDKEIEDGMTNDEPIALLYAGNIAFENLKYEQYVREEGDNGYDFIGLRYDEELWLAARNCYYDAAMQGEVLAMYNLAVFYLTTCEELDQVIHCNEFYFDHAYFWHEVATESGSDANIFVYGAQALKWFGKAAQQGYKKAIEFLERYYEEEGFQLEHGCICYVSPNRGKEPEWRIKEQEHWEKEKVEAKVLWEQANETMKKNDLYGALELFREAFHRGVGGDGVYDKSFAEALLKFEIKDMQKKDCARAEALYKKGCEPDKETGVHELTRRDYWWEAMKLHHIPSIEELKTEYSIATWSSETGEAIAKILYDRAMTLHEKQRSTEAFPIFEKLAFSTDPKPNFMVAGYYFHGLGVPQDFKKALSGYEYTADLGLSHAQQCLAVMYVKGLGTKKDMKKAIKWFTKAAEQGLDLSQFELGVIYYEGNGVKKDESKGLDWLFKAAKQELSVAKEYLTKLGYN